MVKLGQNAQARNVPFMPHDNMSAEEKDGVYGLFNGKTEGADGVSMVDFMAIVAEIRAKMAELNQ